MTLSQLTRKGKKTVENNETILNLFLSLIKLLQIYMYKLIGNLHTIHT